MKRLYLLLLLTACMQANDQQEKSYTLGTIPILKAPVKIMYGNHKYPLAPLTASTLLHATLAATSTASGMRARITQHALLWTASQTIGALNTLSHEIGHTIGHYMRNDEDLEIKIWGGLTTLLTGRYGGEANYVTSRPGPPEKITKEAALEYINRMEKYTIVRTL